MNQIDNIFTNNNVYSLFLLLLSVVNHDDCGRFHKMLDPCDPDSKKACKLSTVTRKACL